jgi:hypothetical protein
LAFNFTFPTVSHWHAIFGSFPECIQAKPQARVARGRENNTNLPMTV